MGIRLRNMRRRRKAVQEQNGGSIPGTGFAIEDFQPLHFKRAIENGRRNRVRHHFYLSPWNIHLTLQCRRRGVIVFPLIAQSFAAWPRRAVTLMSQPQQQPLEQLLNWSMMTMMAELVRMDRPVPQPNDWVLDDDRSSKWHVTTSAPGAVTTPACALSSSP